VRVAEVSGQEGLTGQGRDGVPLAEGLGEIAEGPVEGAEAGGVVEELEDAHRPAQAGLHHLVDLGRAGHPDLNEADRLGQEQVDEAGHEEAGGVGHHDRPLAD